MNEQVRAVPVGIRELTRDEQEIVAENSYMSPVVLPPGLCALMIYAHTVGIVVNIHAGGYERRYCYDSYVEAAEALRDWITLGGDHPPGPWIKVKGSYRGQHVDARPGELVEPQPQPQPGPESTGFPALDSVLASGGFRTGDFALVFGKANAGRSRLGEPDGDA